MKIIKYYDDSVFQARKLLKNMNKKDFKNSKIDDSGTINYD
ncbi:hypothetical protein LALCM10_160142 [Dellaglioa algida]|nr:hypothetical protein LALCM10_160142 [Dellaglioa algida]